MCKAANQNEDFTKTQILEVQTVSRNWQLIRHTPLSSHRGMRKMIWCQAKNNYPFPLCCAKQGIWHTLVCRQ